MQHHTYMVVKQEYPESDAPFAINRMTIDEVRERVTNRIVETGIKTRIEAETRVRQLEAEQDATRTRT
jgi:hypothetical protein